MLNRITNFDVEPDVEWVRDQTQERTDTVVGIMLIRLHQLQDARARGDAEAAERAELALTGMFMMAGDSPRTAYDRVRRLLGQIDTAAPETLVPWFWRRDLTMFQRMDAWRQFLGYQRLHGSDTGVAATRDRLLGALLACGLPPDRAGGQLQELVANAAVARWYEEGGASALRGYAIRYALAR
ncbi:hypothetical protein [Myxococcus sp. RHSTA-1-4]|uniref:hypothetical protein n=1 Tax=Myxococcus sp. RHSTA-1-4 TaxID=2874601 RepID=UPI001CC1A5F9|nr:hypothetical protein [Myxococcus sp. RHSTA-1-4]MBZ4418050.1 hypothetical protein [Myxococcus sp. RHSTA-1-4]